MAMKSNKPHGSPAYISSRVGAGEYAGAGELPLRGPGVAAPRKFSGANQEMPQGKTPSGSAPKGMKTYAAQ